MDRISDNSPTTGNAATEDQFVQEQVVNLFLQQNKRAQSGLLLCAACLFGLLLFRVDAVWPFAWVLVVLVVSATRFLLSDRFVREGPLAPVPAVALLLLVNGLLLMAPLAAFGALTDVERAFVTIVLVALATGSVGSTSGYRHLFLYFAAPMLVPLAAAWVWTHLAPDSSRAGVAMGVLLVFYLVFLLGLGRDAFRVFDDSCRIRFAERALNSRLGAALEEARQASQAKTRFLAAASHDLRQPLHTMGVLLAAISLRQLDTRSREIIQMLESVSRSLSGQLDGLLDISKLDAGIVKPDMKVHRLDELVQSHVCTLLETARQKGLYIRAHCSGPVLAMTDLHLLQRVIGNLTTNALKFTREGGIDLTVRVAGPEAVIEVADTGVGIAPDQQQLVFQEFYQVGNEARDRAHGLGLGLAIVQRVCGLLGIAVQLYSELGKGSRFVLRLPLALPRPEPVAPAAVVPAGGLQALRVLVVDDEPEIREGMRVLLEELGCQVLLADGIAQAVQWARAQPLELVISDFRLRHGESGLDALRLVRELQPRVRLLLISGDTSPDRLQEAHAAQIPMLHKPVQVDQLLSHLQLRP